ncbi:GNAT family N-acetyltransferase [Paraglaciecola aquimarina]|uniref:GNAT family N-acetyltransferase n=1 Tax=Paraglaciecola algarum TaxID=3050085 RepID=A0ABS9D4X5_9ALTE|nr:GNAT family N-acetyltransferase [Paraglaciecola sp. G1-23]MCF2947960.1 GNAT family N-acetyltransferase [Paraglaciecola sp. G1-23]
MAIIIYQATHRDLIELSQLFDLYRVFYQQDSNLVLAKHFIEARLDKQNSVIFVAQDSQQQLIGFTQLYPSFSSVSAQHTWILNDLYVLETQRKQGVAKALLQQAKHHARSTYSAGLSLVTAQTNLAAQKLYQSEGYKKLDFYNFFLAC